MAFLTQNKYTVMLPALDRNSGWTTLVFQILLTAQGAFSVEGVATTDVSFFQVFGFGTRKSHRENWLK